MSFREYFVLFEVNLHYMGAWEACIEDNRQLQMASRIC